MPTTTTPLTGAPVTGTGSAAAGEQQGTTDKPILVATDASESADAAFTAARLLAQRCGAPVEVLAVTEPALVHLPAFLPLVPPPDLDVLRMEGLRDRARTQLRRIVGDDTGWHVETRYGEPAPTIQRVAVERKAGLVVTGLSRHGVLDRIYGEETNASIVQLTTVPLLAVAGGTDRLPRSVIIAIDPRTAPLPESVAIRTLLSEVTTARFVYVAPDTMEMTHILPPAPWPPSYVEDVQAAYQRVLGSLDLPAGVSTELVMLAGSSAKEILRFTNEIKADLIVVGQRRQWMVRRWIGGGLATRLLRGSTCSVLVVPRPRRMRDHARENQAAAGRTETIVNREEWPTRLAELSHRNAGRRVALEVDDPELGAQAEATNFPFLGMDYDRSDDRIAIMLGNPAGGTSHITHSVAAPISVDILEGHDGKTLALRVEVEMGQTLLTFVV